MEKISLIYCLLFTVSLFFAPSCKNNQTVAGNLPTTPAHTPQTTPSGPLYIYGNYFQAQNSGTYKELLESCRRCGTRRFITGPWGGTSYQRFYTLSDNPKRCNNWVGQGYIQIIFKEKRLPTTATVSILPKYTGSGQVLNPWGEPFEVTAEARPINENKGFEIVISPSAGLKGVHDLTIQSSHSHHVEDSRLSVTVVYGSVDGPTILSETLIALSQRAVKKATFDCATYTN